MSSALKGIKVLDLSRVLAGPSATQILGDLGADVVKVERPGQGDDTRRWGPPFVTEDSTESAYYLSANRSKRSIALDMSDPTDLTALKDLIAEADILVENFKVGALAKYDLSYDDLKEKHPSLIYASLTGFGQTGPEKNKPGYDFMIQGMGGIMSVTGAPDGTPYKTGVAIADLMAGQYMLNGILAALYARTQTGRGQHIDIALFDTQLAWLANLGQYYLTSGESPPRVGNAHATIVPYDVFETADHPFILAIGNDKQFQDFCIAAGIGSLAKEEKYSTNPVRVQNRTELISILSDTIKQKPQKTWLELCAKNGIPAGPVNTIAEAFTHQQTRARDMIINMNHPDTEQPIRLIGNPIKLSDTPITYDKPPPKCDADRETILKEWLGIKPIR